MFIWMVQSSASQIRQVSCSFGQTGFKYSLTQKSAYLKNSINENVFMDVYIKCVHACTKVEL